MNALCLLRRFELPLLVCVTCFLCISCSSKNKNNKPDKGAVQGTWKGTAGYKLISEYKVYTPLLEDSLTKLRDSMIVMPDVVLDVAKEELRFYGLKDLSSVVYKHHWEEDQLILQRGIPVERSIQSTSLPLEVFSNPPSTHILKLDADSLVMQLAVYTGSWNDYLLKLKRE